MSRGRKAALALADGRVFWGRAFGADVAVDSPSIGEVVFNTSMYGYQEILTDPSYSGQIITFTYPHIGNVGCNPLDDESSKVHVEGVLVRDLSCVESNFRSHHSLDQYLGRAGIGGIADIDTRELVKHIRDKGAQMGAMASGESLDIDTLVDRARSAPELSGRDLVKGVTCARPYAWSELPWSLEGNRFREIKQNQLWSRPHLVAVDCGIKFNILRMLLDVGFRVTVVPATIKPEAILELAPDALFISNGPGDPAPLDYLVATVKNLLGRFPVFGICLGHQILAQALGGETFKLKFGHRGGNHPVMDLKTKVVEITVQNHGFSVSDSGLPCDVLISHINLNDRTVEGLEARDARAFSVQYHPEASPGPHDSAYLFRRFFELVVGFESSVAVAM